MKTETVKTPLTTDQLESLAGKVTEAEKSLFNAEQSLAIAADAWKNRRKTLKAEVDTCRYELHELARLHREGVVEEEVEVDEKVVGDVVHVFRCDTGATIRTRPLESNDQLTIPEDSDVDDDPDTPEDTDDPTTSEGL